MTSLTVWRVVRVLVAAAAIAAAIVSISPVVHAQTATQSETSPTAGYQDGFFVQSANGDNRLLFGFIGQMDGRFSVDDPAAFTNTFVIRKVRPTFSGRVARYFDFKIMPDFGNGLATLFDAYFDMRFSPKFRVRTGKDKTPVGYEALIGDAFLLFPERSQTSNLLPGRDVGVQVQGDLSPKIFYAGGLFHGVVDGANSVLDIDSNSGKDLAGRIVVQPFRTAGASGGALNGLGFQVGGSTGKQAGLLPAFRTSAMQFYFTYAQGAVADGRRTRISPAIFYYYKSLGVFSEYARSTQRVTRAAITDDVTNTGWNVSGSFMLTGEAATTGITRPQRVFDPPTGKWGALQIVARYAQLDVDDDLFELGFAGAGAADKARSFTVGVNWYPASVVKYYLNYERTDFHPGTAPDRPAENIVLFRVQLGI